MAAAVAETVMAETSRAADQARRLGGGRRRCCRAVTGGRRRRQRPLPTRAAWPCRCVSARMSGRAGGRAGSRARLYEPHTGRFRAQCGFAHRAARHVTEHEISFMPRAPALPVAAEFSFAEKCERVNWPGNMPPLRLQLLQRGNNG